MGDIHLNQKQFADALKFYQEALEKSPSSADGLKGVIYVYSAQKQFDKAIAAANAQIAKVPNNSSFYEQLGTVLYDGKKGS